MSLAACKIIRCSEQVEGNAGALAALVASGLVDTGTREGAVWAEKTIAALNAAGALLVEQLDMLDTLP